VSATIPQFLLIKTINSFRLMHAGQNNEAKPYRDKWTKTISEKVFERTKGIIRALPGDALPEAPAGVDEHPNCHHHQQRVPKAVVTHQNESTLPDKARIDNLSHVPCI